MIFTSKVFKLGNSVAIYIPKDTNKLLKCGEVYTFKVLLDGEKDVPDKVLVNADDSGLDIHVPQFTFHNPKDKKLVFNGRSGQNEWQ
jgi:hypothetical protein